MNHKVLLDTHRLAGASLVLYGDRWVPAHYGSVDKEHRAVRETSGLIDLSHWTKIGIAGTDRKTFLHGLVSNDVKTLSPGNGNYSLFLTPHGKIQADFFVFDREYDYLLLGRESILEPLVAGLNKYLIMEAVTIKDLTHAECLLSLQGPHSSEILPSLLNEGTLPIHDYQHSPIQLSGISCRCIRLSHTAEVGYDLLVSPESAPHLWQALVQAGAAPVGLEAWEILRVEAGVPILGKELDQSVIPQEAALEHALSFKKGCYIGQETVARLQFRGHVNRELTGFVMETNPVRETPLPIYFQEKEVGVLTSVVLSPSLKQTIALGYLRCDLRKPGMEVWDGLEETKMRVVVYHLPFVEWVHGS